MAGLSDTASSGAGSSFSPEQLEELRRQLAAPQQPGWLLHHLPRLTMRDVGYVEGQLMQQPIPALQRGDPSDPDEQQELLQDALHASEVQRGLCPEDVANLDTAFIHGPQISYRLPDVPGTLHPLVHTPLMDPILVVPLGELEQQGHDIRKWAQWMWRCMFHWRPQLRETPETLRLAFTDLVALAVWRQCAQLPDSESEDEEEMRAAELAVAREVVAAGHAPWQLQAHPGLPPQRLFNSEEEGVPPGQPDQQEAGLQEASEASEDAAAERTQSPGRAFAEALRAVQLRWRAQTRARQLSLVQYFRGLRNEHRGQEATADGPGEATSSRAGQHVLQAQPGWGALAPTGSQDGARPVAEADEQQDHWGGPPPPPVAPGPFQPVPLPPPGAEGAQQAVPMEDIVAAGPPAGMVQEGQEGAAEIQPEAPEAPASPSEDGWGGSLERLLARNSSEWYPVEVARPAGAKAWRDATGAGPLRIKRELLDRARMPLGDAQLGKLKRLAEDCVSAICNYRAAYFKSLGGEDGPRPTPPLPLWLATPSRPWQPGDASPLEVLARYMVQLSPEALDALWWASDLYDAAAVLQRLGPEQVDCVYVIAYGRLPFVLRWEPEDHRGPYLANQWVDSWVRLLNESSVGPDYRAMEFGWALEDAYGNYYARVEQGEQPPRSEWPATIRGAWQGGFSELSAHRLHLLLQGPPMVAGMRSVTRLCY